MSIKYRNNISRLLQNIDLDISLFNAVLHNGDCFAGSWVLYSFTRNAGSWL